MTALTDEERAAWKAVSYYARVHGIVQPPENAFLDALPAARDATTRLLLQTLLRRPPDALQRGDVSPPEDLAIPPFVDDGVAEAVRRYVRSLPEPTSQVAVQPFPASKTVVVAGVDGLHGYDRYRVGAEVVSVADGSARLVGQPLELVDLVLAEDPFVDDHEERFRRVIAQSVSNLAMSLVAGRNLEEDEDNEVDAFDGPHRTATLALERRTAIHGHPDHPYGKSHVGMDPVDALLYAPEFTDTVDLRFVALHDECAFSSTATGKDPLTRSLLETFDGLESAVQRALPPGRSPESYHVVPVHPFQFREVVPRLLADAGSEHLVPIVEYAAPVTPLLNLRTVVPDGSGRGAPIPRIKLPVDVEKMNIARDLPLEEIADGPRLSELFSRLFTDDPVAGFDVLSEYAGTCYDPGDGQTARTFDKPASSHLSALLRPDPADNPLVGPDDVPVTAACLPTDVPGRRLPPVGSFIERYADAHGISSEREAAVDFFASYVDCVVPGPLWLMTKYGIGLEPHAQNTVVVFDRDARPTASLVRDFGGIRAVTDRLESCGHAVDLHPDSAANATREEMYEMIHALYVRHIGELVVTLVRDFRVDEDACWRRVRDTSEDVFDRLRGDPEVPADRVERDAEELFGAPATMMSMSAMRGVNGSHYLQVSNPLSEGSADGE